MLDLSQAIASFERLTSGQPVHFAPDACLIVRRAGAECGICRDVCPTSVLSGGEWSIALEKDGCIGCGLCAVACPTGALRVEGCTPDPVKVAGEQIVLECRRVAAGDRDPNAVAVPCLGGITTPDLLDFLEETEGRVVFADRGWCAACPVAHCDAPWQSTLDETRSLLASVDARLADDVVVERRELPASLAKPAATALRPDQPVGRRDFFKRIIAAIEPRDPLAESRRVVFGRGLISPLKRKRIYDRIAALASDLERPVPASLMPAIKVSAGCELDGLCVAICPTGALRREEAGDTVSLQFESANCIACGLCQGVCTNKALSLWPEGDGTVPDGPTVLVTRRAFTCAGCGDSFVSSTGGQFCSQCSKAMTLMHELSSLKFGPTSNEQARGLLKP